MTVAPRSLPGALAALAALLGVLLLGTPAVAQGTSMSVTATASPTTSGAIEVAWTPVPGAVGYIVVPQRLRTTGEWTAVADRAERLTNVRPVVFDGLVDGASYRACVAAVTPDGYVTATSTSAVPYGLPDAPVITDVARIGTTLEITWTAPAGNGRPVTSYTLGISPADVAEQAVPGNQTSAIIEGVDAQTAYTVTLRATNLRGQSPAASSGITTTVSAAADVEVPVITVAALLPAPSGDVAHAGASVRTVSDAGPCAGAVATDDGTNDGGGTGGTGSGPASGGSTTAPGGSGASAPQGTTSGTTRPRPSGTGVGTTEERAAAEGSGAAPTQRPESGAAPAPAAPESAAPDTAASGDAAAPSEAATARRSRWVLGLLVLASAVIAAPMLIRRARGGQSGA